MIDRDLLISAVGAWVGNCLIFDQLDSTHFFARRLMEQVDTEDIPISPTLILAESQSGGIGRAQRTWSSESGGLYFNVVWSLADPSCIAQLPMLAAATIHQAVTAVGVKDAAVKWPNDILVHGRKLGGVLIHALHGARLLGTVGVGITTTETPDLSDIPGLAATSLADILGPGDADERSTTLITTFLERFTKSLHNPEPTVEHWKAHLIHTEGETISLTTSSGQSISGTYSGVNSAGHLMMQTSDGLKTLTGGDIVEEDENRETR
ncbi:MAG: biotin--[acetyl-CoA-carboxylase] ligase [Acidobacteria bacterium]|nr:MAG: biotin--[acetyl-CoA-carboxylase] ligase [Acidobacteriota bacterium]